VDPAGRIARQKNARVIGPLAQAEALPVLRQAGVTIGELLRGESQAAGDALELTILQKNITTHAAAISTSIATEFIGGVHPGDPV